MGETKPKWVPPQEGGSYKIEKGSTEAKLVERTVDHPEGNWARPAEEPEAGANAEQPAQQRRGLFGLGKEG